MAASSPFVTRSAASRLVGLLGSCLFASGCSSCGDTGALGFTGAATTGHAAGVSGKSNGGLSSTSAAGSSGGSSGRSDSGSSSTGTSSAGTSGGSSASATSNGTGSSSSGGQTSSGQTGSGTGTTTGFRRPTGGYNGFDAGFGDHTTPQIPVFVGDADAGGGLGTGIDNLLDGGGVVLGSGANFVSDFAYVSNSGQHAGSSFVSRINTKTGVEEARYPSVLPLDNGGSNLCTAGQPATCLVDLGTSYYDNAPSRTVVDLNGGVFVTNRGQCDWGLCTADMGNASYNPNNPNTNEKGAVQGSVTYIANRVDHPEQCAPRCQNRMNWNLPDGGAAIFSSGVFLPKADGTFDNIPANEVLTPSPGSSLLSVLAPDLAAHPCLDNGDAGPLAHDSTDVTDPTNYDDCARFTIPLGAPNGYDLKGQTNYTDRFAPRGLAISKNCGAGKGNAVDCDLYVGLTEPPSETAQIVHLGFKDNFAVVQSIDTGLTNYGSYGAAIDCEGVLWASQRAGGRVGIDTATDQPVTTWNYSDSKGVHQLKTVTDSSGTCDAYGIAVDTNQHAWTAMVKAAPDGGKSQVGACSFDYGAFRSAVGLQDGGLSQVDAQSVINTFYKSYKFYNAAPGAAASRGIVVDKNGTVYMAYTGNPGMIAFDPVNPANNTQCGQGQDSPCLWNQTGVSGGPTNAWGVDLDQDGNPLVALRSSGVVGLSATDGTPLPLYNQGQGIQIHGTNGGDDLYTYSDFTGYALRQITQPDGVYQEVIAGCDPVQAITTWTSMDYAASLPPGSSITFQLDTAAHLNDFSSVNGVIEATFTCNSLQSCATPVALGSLGGTYLRITATLVAPPCSVSGSPTLDWLQFGFSCAKSG